jgi:hypothetical protein
MEIDKDKFAQTSGAVVKSGAPWALLATVAMGVAKFGFGFAIPMWFVLLPLYIGLLALGMVLAIIAVGCAVVGIFVLAGFCYEAIVDKIRARKSNVINLRPRNVRYA